MEENLTISVVIPVHSRIEYLKEAIDSLLAQTHPIDHIIVVSDREDALEVIRSYIGKIYYFPTQDFGQAESINFGMGFAPSQVVFSLDDDDKIKPDYVEKCLDAMKKTNADIVYSDMEMFGMESQIVNALDWNLENFTKTTVPFGVAIMKRYVWDSIRYKSGIQYIDWDFWWTAFEKGYTTHHLQEPLFLYRTHMGQQSRSCNVDEEVKKIRNLHGYS